MVAILVERNTLWFAKGPPFKRGSSRKNNLGETVFPGKNRHGILHLHSLLETLPLILAFVLKSIHIILLFWEGEGGGKIGTGVTL